MLAKLEGIKTFIFKKERCYKSSFLYIFLNS